MLSRKFCRKLCGQLRAGCALPGHDAAEPLGYSSFRERPSQKCNADMAQIFHRSTNFISRFSLFSAVFLVGLGLVGVLGLARSPYSTNQNVSRAQPVQFSHKHHVGDDGLDCRYCHTSVETSAVQIRPPAILPQEVPLSTARIRPIAKGPH